MAFANAIGIEVIIEIDVLGHTYSVAASNPDIVSCPNFDWQTHAAEPPAGQLRPTSEKAINLVKDVFREVLQDHDYPGQFFSTGGDEVNLQCYDSDPQLQADLAAKGQSLHEALADFTE